MFSYFLYQLAVGSGPAKGSGDSGAGAGNGGQNAAVAG